MAWIFIYIQGGKTPKYSYIEQEDFHMHAQLWHKMFLSYWKLLPQIIFTKPCIYALTECKNTEIEARRKWNINFDNNLILLKQKLLIIIYSR